MPEIFAAKRNDFCFLIGLLFLCIVDVPKTPKKCANVLPMSLSCLFNCQSDCVGQKRGSALRHFALNLGSPTRNGPTNARVDYLIRRREMALEKIMGNDRLSCRARAGFIQRGQCGCTVDSGLKRQRQRARYVLRKSS